MSRTQRTLMLVVAILALLAWLALGFVVPVGAGWAHLFLPLALVAGIVWVVTGPPAC